MKWIIFSCRYRLEDFEGKMLSEAESIRHKLPAYISPYTYKDWGTGVGCLSKQYCWLRSLAFSEVVSQL